MASCAGCTKLQHLPILQQDGLAILPKICRSRLHRRRHGKHSCRVAAVSQAATGTSLGDLLKDALKDTSTGLPAATPEPLTRPQPTPPSAAPSVTAADPSVPAIPSPAPNTNQAASSVKQAIQDTSNITDRLQSGRTSAGSSTAETATQASENASRTAAQAGQTNTDAAADLGNSVTQVGQNVTESLSNAVQQQQQQPQGEPQQQLEQLTGSVKSQISDLRESALERYSAMTSGAKGTGTAPSTEGSGTPQQLEQLKGSVKSQLSDLRESALDRYNAMTSGAKGVKVSSSTATVPGTGGGAADGLQSTTNSITQQQLAVQQGTGQAASDLTSSLREAATDITESLNKASSGALTGLQQSFSAATDSLEASTSGARSSLQSAVEGASEQVRAATQSALDALPPELSSSFSSAADAAAPVVDQATRYITSDSRTAAVTAAAGIGVPVYILWRSKYAGYSGMLQPVAAWELLQTENAVLVDIRPEEQRQAEGVAELKRGARGKGAAVEVRPLPATIARQVNNAQDVAVQAAALQIAGLSQVGSGTKVIIMDQRGSKAAVTLARAVRSAGRQGAYVVQGGFAAWVGEGLGVKDNTDTYQSNVLDTISDEAEELVELSSSFFSDPTRAVLTTAAVGWGGLAVYDVHYALEYLGTLSLLLMLVNWLTSYDSPQDLLDDASSAASRVSGLVASSTSRARPALSAVGAQTDSSTVNEDEDDPYADSDPYAESSPSAEQETRPQPEQQKATSTVPTKS